MQVAEFARLSLLQERAAHIAVPLDLVSAQSQVSIVVQLPRRSFLTNMMLQMQAAVGAQAQAEAFAAAEAKAQAKAEYDATMAKMQAMSDKLGHMAEVFPSLAWNEHPHIP